MSSKPESLSVLNNAANRLTLLRGFLIPFFAIFFLLPDEWGHWSNQTAAIILCVAAITDFLDGIVARSYRQETRVGEYLDQAVDKVLVVTALLLILFRYPEYIVFIPVLVTVLREFCVLSMREWLQRNTSVNVSVGRLGKIKTVIQFVSLICLFWSPDLQDFVGIVGLVMLYLATIMTLVSAGVYVRTAIKDQSANPTDELSLDSAAEQSASPADEQSVDSGDERSVDSGDDQSAKLVDESTENPADSPAENPADGAKVDSANDSAANPEK
ncbi:MAG: CDP-diacylglycerol--glycerol-3-phosphate 3-phosphatidyltransferase [Gammaproteobacteria bacterium]|nr:CDP-diacylglycerol--glycerol-3-phosphate 3-phosphatidyltransferase [Gammaproteobacteria bacterium]